MNLGLERFHVFRLQSIFDSWEEDLPLGTTLSLLPLFGGAQGVVTKGLAYPLKNNELVPGELPSGVSNLVVASPVTVTLQKGQLLLIVQHTVNN